MRRNAFLAFSLLTLMATVFVAPACAASKVEYRANGKVTTYDGNQYPPGDPSSVVMGGEWSLMVKGGVPDFQLSYREMNLISELEGGAPVGSVDHFKIVFDSPDGVNPPFMVDDEGAWVVTGNFNVDKLAVQPDGSKVWIHGFLSPQGGAVHIYPGGGLTLDVGLWHLMGTVKLMK